ncbi:MAG: DUF669 domain-containing protein [Ignavibacteria bacterium]|jgi:hypothetical protein|nr:DUF669 domain-containing protein [Ignavibacteria bacterium]
MAGNPFGGGSEDGFSVDLTQVEEQGKIPAGTYPAEVIGLEKTVSQNSGNRMWVWKFMINDGDYEGRKFQVYSVLTPKGLWRVAEILNALHLGKAGEEVNFTLDQVIGGEVLLQIVDDVYNGEPRSSVKHVKPVSEEV